MSIPQPVCEDCGVDTRFVKELRYREEIDSWYCAECWKERFGFLAGFTK